MTILPALNAYYDRLAGRGEVPPFGYSTEGISFALVLAPDGTVVEVKDLRTPAGRKPTPRPVTVPQSFKRPGTTPRSFFLWDNTKFVLGLGVDKATGDRIRFDAHHSAFRDRHRELLSGSNDEGLVALLRFLEGWISDTFDPPLFDDEMLDQNLAFILDGDRQDDGRPRFLHDRPAARRIWEMQAAEASGAVQTCLVTGNAAPAARLHPSIRGVLGAQPMGASLVSFNLDAFTSYGKEQGANAPVSEAAAFAYGTALNALLARDSRKRTQIGDATTVFWAEASHGHEPAAQTAEDLLAQLLAPPPPDDTQEARRIRDVLAMVKQGRAVSDIDPSLDADTRFFILGLAPNSARLAVRFWHQDRFGDLVARIGEHWRDLDVAPYPWRTAPSAWALLLETALQRKAENIPPLLGGELMRAILTGGRYPRSLLSAVLLRIRADGAVTGERAAICKACLCRDARMGFEKEDVPVGLNRDEKNPAYRLGRLFAVLENVQRSALGRINATIRDRYFGAASATPASVFPFLLRNANHHLAVLRKKNGTGGLAYWFEAEIGQILNGIDMDFPRSLRIQDQGRFAVGYYHQRATRKAEGETEADTTPAPIPTEA